MSPHRRQVREAAAELLTTSARLRDLGVEIQHSSDYSNSPLEPLLAKAGGVRWFIAAKTNSVTGGVSWGLRWRLADRVILQSNVLARELAKRSPRLRDKIVVIPNGVRTDMYRPCSDTGPDQSRPAWLGQDKLTLVCVAHLVKAKDHLSLIRALARARNRSRIVVPLIGNGVDADYADAVRAEATSLGLGENVVMIGARSDLPAILPYVNGIILTSIREALSNAVLEGMSCGLPVICSDVGGMSDLARPGVNGWLVQRGPGFVEKLAEAIDEWAEDGGRRGDFGRASRRIVEREFSIEQMVRKHIELYDSLMV
jgi:glycosyltransferase involved in cell wall biosynthesis